MCLPVAMRVLTMSDCRLTHKLATSITKLLRCIAVLVPRYLVTILRVVPLLQMQNCKISNEGCRGFYNLVGGGLTVLL